MANYEEVKSEECRSTYENDKCVLKVFTDEDAQDPREEMDNVGKMICWHRRYNLGDEHNYANWESFWSGLADEFGVDTADGERPAAEVVADLQKHIVVLPLYLYDHSGITMSTSAFSCPWDSGQVGWIYCTMQQVQEEWSGDVEAAKEYLKGEVKTYDLYLRGDVLGYVLYKKIASDCEACGGDPCCAICDGIELEEVDSCGGFCVESESDLIAELSEEWRENLEEV